MDKWLVLVRSNKVLLSLMLVFFLFSSHSIAEETEGKAQQWLEKMSQAIKKLNYRGTVVFFKNGRLDTMRYVHASNNGKEQERLISLNSPMREVVREAGKVSCFFKKSGQLVVNHRPVSRSFIVDLPADFFALKNVYQFSVSGEESVAMLPSVIISIKPKDKYRYGRKIWIDKQHYLPLKVEVSDLSGKTLGQVFFTNLQVGHTLFIDNVEKNLVKKKIKHIHQLESLAVDKADFVLNNIPSGFKIVFFTQMKMDKSVQFVDHLLLSDGFSSISVYREAKVDDSQEGLQTLGTVNLFSRVIENNLITVMGEVPAKTVQFIAQGVKEHARNNLKN